MTEYFKKGFLKTASPELIHQSNYGDSWNEPTDYQQKRQKLLEEYEKKSKERDNNNPKKAVKEEYVPFSDIRSNLYYERGI